MTDLRKWQPIKTAPADGTPFLALLRSPYDPDGYGPKSRVVIADMIYTTQGLCVSFMGSPSVFYLDEYSYWFEVIGWQPLPPVDDAGAD